MTGLTGFFQDVETLFFDDRSRLQGDALASRNVRKNVSKQVPEQLKNSSVMVSQTPRPQYAWIFVVCDLWDENG